ncbi:hypothetical protein G8C92_30840 [Paenibacillus donghaensis]|uniref:YfjL-like protein n=1 Tax=Paenibacillus donghaensis TaxID=414771 RepID=UPI00188452D7|nr:hypothetical protein [Paenibacillus donghaensis]MBE9918395.1 hypothetical protein [Paenibacillus donghaensis]
MVIYSFFNGKPWEKNSFAKEVAEYISLKYPELEIDNKNIKYDFKEMNYIATLKTTQEIKFHVKDYNGSLEDDYYVSIWNTKVSNELTSLIRKKDKEGSARYFIEGISNDEMKKYKDYSLHSELSHEIQTHSKIFIYFSNDFSGSSHQLQNCYEIIEEVKEKKREANIVFFFRKSPMIVINIDQLDKVKDRKDIENFIVDIDSILK